MDIESYQDAIYGPLLEQGFSIETLNACHLISHAFMKGVPVESAIEQIGKHLRAQAATAPKETAPQTVAELRDEHGGIWGEHPSFPIRDWQHEVNDGNTRSGYWEWVFAEIEAATSE